MRTIALLSIATVIFVACQSNSPDHATTPDEHQDSTLSPVETKKPNTTYKPAFEGQTRIAGVRTKAGLDVKVVAEGLRNPWGMVNLPDGRILITEKGGTMRIVSTSGQLSAPITGLPPVNDSGQGGLLDVAIDPDFSQNRLVYWSFSQNVPPGTLTALGKGKLSADEQRIEGAEVIYQAKPAFNSSLHYGSRLVWDKQGNLFMSTGERSDIVSRPQAQQLNSALGKVLHLTKDGKPVAGNPFMNKDGALPEIYSYGHRNVQGLATHPETGDLWEIEFGPRGGDEVNRIQAGKDYGWPEITYGLEYSGERIGKGITQKEGMEQPVYYWDPVVSPSGAVFYSGNMFPEWKNNLFIGALSGMHIVRLVIKDNKVVGEERLLEDMKNRIRDVLQGSDGSLYAITDGGNGKLIQIRRK
ncbi:PQQ-dependent sugar dehydrogenase [Arcticibacter tournemirensis]|uniref:PQQ-dependent sugar dehydrogenase n=1 Tax=Arcticibacter tournemirensis TaxID=699437 RepID=A0A4Q0M4L3_9SPHI|nr:PQQ-dependent sugar dehydrogenase [Arcticibacter tournemirensis]RXF67910.1 PQQ-dependent sugar dehydrogenase [Arcticibacter tournemirensis]